MKIQLALDFIDENQALKVVEKIGSDVDIIEVGTSLVKLKGIDFVKKIKNIVPDKEIFYDLKTIDGPEREAQIVNLSGAKRCSMLGFATIYSAEKFINKLNPEIIVTVDLQSASDKVTISKQFAGQGMKSFCIHRTEGDAQSIEENIHVFDQIRSLTGAEMMIAGGINLENVGEVVTKFKPDILVIGGAIAKAEDPQKALAQVKKIIGL